MRRLDWERYPLIGGDVQAHAWLNFQCNRGLAMNTILTYGYALESFLAFCQSHRIAPQSISREQTAHYVRSLREGTEQNRQRALSNATQQVRLTVVRLFQDFLVEEGLREFNPVGRGRYVSGNSSAGKRGLIPRQHKLPWIPTEDDWQRLLNVVKQETLRNRLMFMLAYDGALRREELCSLQTHNIDPAMRLIQIEADYTKNRRARTVPFSEITMRLYMAYLQERREISRERGVIFLSTSNRNHGQPITLWAWSKVCRNLALQAQVEGFSTHTLRHLCLTDLARAGWDIHEIAEFAGHSDTQTTLKYIHVSGRELAAKLNSSLGDLHRWRVATIAEGGRHDLPD